MALPETTQERLASYFNMLVGPHEVSDFQAMRWEQEARSALAANPQDADALQLLGGLAVRAEDIPVALDWFRRACAVDDAPIPRLNLSLALLHAEEAREALDWLGLVLAEHPETFDGDSDDAIWATGAAVSVLACAERRGAAAQLLREPLHACDPRNPDHLYWLRGAAHALGDAATAAELAGRMVAALGLATWNPLGGIATRPIRPRWRA